MTDQSVFSSNDNTQETPVTTTPSPDAFTDQLASIKNENGVQKYKTVDEALNALKHSQDYIPQVKGELAAKDEELVKLKAQLDASTTIEQAVQKLAEQQSQPNENTTQVAGLDEQAVLDLINKATSEQAAAKQKKTNVNQVNQAISGKFGDKAQEVVAAKAKELGMTPEALEKMSEQNPQVVLQLFNTSATASTTPTTTSIHIPNNPTQQSTDLQRPEKSLLMGATMKEQADYMRKVRDSVYAKFDVTQ